MSRLPPRATAIAPSAPDPLPLDQIAAYTEPSTDPAFFSLNSIAARCRHRFEYGRLLLNEAAENNWYFCKTDYLEYFFANHAPVDDFVLLSGNSDLKVGRRYARHLKRRNLVAWFAANLELRHPKAFPLAIGMANPSARWPNGDSEVLRAARDANVPKTELFHAGFALHTNPKVRERCLRETGVPRTPPASFDEYVMQLAASYFCLSPEGKGIDCHRTWEALYVKTIPVVTRSVLAEHYRDFPIVVLDDWSQFKTIQFTPDLYRSLWQDWSVDEISLEGYLRRIEERVAVSTGAPGGR